MTKNEAFAIGNAYIALQNKEQPFHPDYEYTISACEEYFDCWYFDFSISNRRGLPESEWELFAGAPGFVVSKINNSVTVIAWLERRQLAQREELFQKSSVIAAELLGSGLTLHSLRQHIKLPLNELTMLKRTLDAPDLSDHQKKSLLVSQFMMESELPFTF